MKKIYSILICLFVIAPSMLFLASCGEVKTYAIEIKSNDSRYGTVNAVDGNYAEGSSVTLRANPLLDSNFLCWTLDDVVVSKSSEYAITITQQTQGKYVAIFDKACQYYTITEVTYSGENQDQLDIIVETGSSISSTKTVYSSSTTPSESKYNYNLFGSSFYNKTLIEADFTKTNYYCGVTVNTKKDGNQDASYNDNSVSISSLFEKDSETFEFFTDQSFSIKVTFSKLTQNIVNQMI